MFFTESPAGKDSPAKGTSPSQGPVDVLLVDDQAARLLTYELMLADLDVRCSRAQSGKDALEQLLRQAFALILLDVSMPGMDGFETARLIRSHPRFERTPIIFVTGVNISQLDALRGYEAGAIDYMSVPVEPAILRSKVKWLADMHRRQVELQRLNAELQQSRATLEEEKREFVARSQLQLRKSEDRYRTIFEMPSQYTVVAEPVLDSGGGVVDWRCCDANANAAQLLQRARTDLIGSTLTQVLPERAGRLVPLWAEVRRQGTLYTYEAQFGGRDFLLQLFPMAGDALVCSGLDITARTAAEKEAKRLSALDRAEKDWLAALLQSMTEEVYFADSSERYTYANPAALRALNVPGLEGMPVRELVEKLQICHPDGSVRPIEESPALRALRGETVRGQEQRLCLQPGAPWSYRQVSSAPVRDRSGTIIGAVSVVRDTTAQRCSQEALQRSEQQLREADRRKDEFLATLAHELRNPLVPIRMGIELFKRGNHDSAAVERLQSMMARQITHITHLIDDLLDISRITSGKIELKRQWVTLATLVDGAVEGIRQSVQSNGLDLQVCVSDRAIVIEVDPTRITQVISNLLHNAVKFTPRGGRIGLHVSLESALPEQGTQAVIRVSDTGVGIDPRMLGRVFELFVQAEQGDNTTEVGLGIGLALTSKLVQLHGGTIEVRSTGLGQGSDFVVRLPVVTGERAAETPTAAVEQLPGLRVLVVDDNRDGADATALLLQTEQLHAQAVYSGHAALQVLQESQLDLILMDIGMAEMDGLEACRRIRTLYGSAIWLIAISGWGQDKDKARALEAGFDLHMTKPVEPAELRENIRALLRGRSPQKH
jgi:signal transduction histidine kinase/DNA-binding response OmpR family regulator